MSVSIKHKFTSPKVDSPDSTKVQPSNWNDEHDLLIGANAVLGRGAGAGNAAAVEIPTTTMGRSLMNAADAAAARTLIDAAPSSSATSTTTVGTAIHAAAAKTTPIDTDTMPLIDSAAANVMKKVTWANIKATLKAAAADVYAAVSNKFLTTDMIETASAEVAMVDAATVSFDWDAGINRSLTITANRMIGNPSNGQPGTYRTIHVKGNDSTARTLTFDATFLGDVPGIIDVSNAKWYLLTIRCIDAAHFVVSAQVTKKP